jgi:hypothetical protein
MCLLYGLSSLASSTSAIYEHLEITHVKGWKNSPPGGAYSTDLY